ncbi:MAG TPA: hypothetical protein VFI28_01000, partial [Candidatus Limnocylindrales bacterium]|nr:hypothetical protein [Candidatus Limnocylindrales bacterium]
DFTSSREPLGAVHDADDGPVAAEGEGGICLVCGAAIDLPPGDRAALVGMRLAGGPPNPGALVSRGRGRGRSGGGKGRASGRRQATGTASRAQRSTAA